MIVGAPLTSANVATTTPSTSTRRTGLFSRLRNRNNSVPVMSSPVAYPTTGTIITNPGTIINPGTGTTPPTTGGTTVPNPMPKPGGTTGDGTVTPTGGTTGGTV